MYIVFGICVVTGQLITCVGCANLSMTVMLIGRIVFGLGGECLNVCQTTIIVKWFYKSEAALPLGLTITLSRLGSVLNDIISPRIAHHDNATMAFWLGFIMTILSLIAILFIFIIDYEKDKALNDNNSNANSDDVIKVSPCELLSHFKQFNLMYWLLTMLCLLTYGCVMPFNYIATGLFTSTSLRDMPAKDARKVAGVYMGIPFFIGAIMVPVFGSLIDKYGNRTIFCLSSGIMCVLTFIFFYIITPVIPLILLGFSYSIFASVVWPSIAIAVNDKEKVGLAFGITTSFQSAGLALFPLIVAAIYASYGSYSMCLVFFAVLGFISMIFGLWIIYENKYHRDGLLDLVTFEDEKEDNVSNERNKEYKDLINEEEVPLKE